MMGARARQRSRKDILGRRNSVDEGPGAGKVCGVSRELYAIAVGALRPGGGKERRLQREAGLDHGRPWPPREVFR